MRERVEGWGLHRGGGSHQLAEGTDEPWRVRALDPGIRVSASLRPGSFPAFFSPELLLQTESADLLAKGLGSPPPRHSQGS